MIEVHLIGYTEDGSELVFDLDPDGEGRYALAVDPDLLATMAAVRQARVAHALPVDARPAEPVTSRPAVSSHPPVAGAGDRDEDRATAGGVMRIRVDAPPPAASEAGRADLPDPAAVRGPEAAEDVEPEAAGTVEPEAAGTVEPEDAGTVEPEAAGRVEPEVAGRVEPEDAGDVETEVETDIVGTVAEPSSNGVTVTPRSALSPADIQRRLRSGRSVSSVAEEAGVERAWIERWLPPILAERDRVLADAWQRAVGDGSEPLLPQVEEALARRGAPDDRTVWSAARRADGRWRVSVRFPEDGRSRSATWTLRAEGGPLTPASPLAAELASRPGRRRRR